MSVPSIEKLTALEPWTVVGVRAGDLLARAGLSEARLVDVIAAALCDQAEEAESRESESWWGLSTDDVAALVAAAVCRSQVASGTSDKEA